MKRRMLKPAPGSVGRYIYSAILLSMMLLFNGCTGKGDLRFNPLPDSNLVDLSGSVKLTEVVETDLGATQRGALAQIEDFSFFSVSVNDVSTFCNKDGSFSLKKVPISENVVIKAKSDKILLMLRISLEELYTSDLSNLELNLGSTAEALVWEKGVELKKNLTAADIRAREYQETMNGIVTAIRLSLQLPDSSVSGTVLDVAAVKNLVSTAASAILEREIVLKEANTVMRHVLLRKDLQLLKTYISPSFSNDWDSSSNYSHVISHFEELFAENSFEMVEWKVKDNEFLPDSRARIRTEVKIQLRNHISEQIVRDNTWTFDAIWRKEGSLWKIFRNMPYLDTHPTQLDADVRWGEIAEAHKELQAAMAAENIASLSTRISDTFGNDWDATSTRNDLLTTAQARFNAMDVKISSYSIEKIEFVGADKAKVSCKANVRVINLVAGIDVDSGNIEAIVEWRKESGVWKIFRNLPYRFSHPKSVK